MAKSKKFDMFSELGVSGVNEYAGLLSDRYAEILRGPAGVSRMARVLRREPAAYTSWSMVTLAASSVRWTVTPAAESKADQAAALFVDQCLQDMSSSLASCVQFAMSSWAFGWATHVIVWKKRNGQNPSGKDAAPSKWDDGLIGLKKLATRRQETLYKWELDATGGLQAMIQTDPATGKQTEPIPIEMLLHYVGGDERGSIEGLGWLEPAYWIAYLIEQLEQIGGATAQRGGTGLPWFKFLSPPDTATLNAVDEIGEGLAAGELQYVKLPGPMVDGDLKTVSLSNLGDIRGWIDQLRWEIAALQAATFVRLGSTERGTQSLGGTMYDAFTLGVDGALDRIQDVWQRHLVPRLLANNPGKFDGISDHPRIGHSRVTVLPPATAQWLANITEFLNVAAPEDAEWLRAIFNMPYKSAKDIEEAQKLAKAEAEKAAAEAQKQALEIAKRQGAAGEPAPGVVPPQLAKSAAAAAAAGGNSKSAKEPPATAPGQKAQAGAAQATTEAQASENVAQNAVASLAEAPATDMGIYPEVVRSALLMAAERIVGGQGADADIELFNPYHRPAGPGGGQFAPRDAATTPGAVWSKGGKRAVIGSEEGPSPSGSIPSVDDENFTHLTDVLEAKFGKHPEFGKNTYGWIAPDGRLLHNDSGGHFSIAKRAVVELGLDADYDETYETLFSRGFVRIVHQGDSTSFEWAMPMKEAARNNLQAAFDELRPPKWYVDFWTGSDRGETNRSLNSRSDGDGRKLRRETGIDIGWWSDKGEED